MSTPKTEQIATSGISRLRGVPAANGAVQGIDAKARQINPGLIPKDATHWSFNRDLVVRFYKRESDAAFQKRIAEEARKRFVDDTEALKNLVLSWGLPYASYGVAQKSEFDAKIENLYRTQWYPLVTESAKAKIGLPKEQMDLVVAFYYPFRGRAEPEKGWFDRTIKKIGTTFGVAVVGFITAGVGAAALGTAAPTAASAGLGAVKGLTGVDVGKLQDNLQGSVADKIQAAQAKAADVIAAAPGALADNAIKKALAGSSESLPMPKVVNVTDSPMADAAKQNVSMAGFGSLAIGLLVVTVLLSKRGN